MTRVSLTCTKRQKCRMLQSHLLKHLQTTTLDTPLCGTRLTQNTITYLIHALEDMVCLDRRQFLSIEAADDAAQDWKTFMVALERKASVTARRSFICPTSTMRTRIRGTRSKQTKMTAQTQASSQSGFSCVDFSRLNKKRARLGLTSTSPVTCFGLSSLTPESTDQLSSSSRM